MNHKINDNWQIKNDYIENLKGQGAKVVIEDNLFYFDNIDYLPDYIFDKVKKIYQAKGLKYAIDISGL